MPQAASETGMNGCGGVGRVCISNSRGLLCGLIARARSRVTLKVRLAASSKRDGNEWVWGCGPWFYLQQPRLVVWADCTCEVAGDAAQNARAVLCSLSSFLFFCIGM